MTFGQLFWKESPSVLKTLPTNKWMKYYLGWLNRIRSNFPRNICSRNCTILRMNSDFPIDTSMLLCLSLPYFDFLPLKVGPAIMIRAGVDIFRKSGSTFSSDTLELVSTCTVLGVTLIFSKKAFHS